MSRARLAPFAAALALAACAHPVAPPRIAAPAPAPEAAPAPAPEAAPAPAPEAAPAPAPAPEAAPEPAAEAEPEPAPASPAPLEPPTVVADAPYPPDHRPRPPGDVNASVDDAETARWNRGGDASGPAGLPPEKAAKYHPATRVRVDVVKTTGRVSASELQRVARSRGYWAYRLCFERAVHPLPAGARTPAGAMTLRVPLPRKGAVGKPKLLERDLESEAIARCVADATRALPLPRPAKGSATATLVVSLWPGDEPLAPAPPEGDAKLPVPAAAASAALASLVPRVQACFAEGLARRPGLWGRLALRLVLDGSGAVVSASEVESRFPEPEVAACAARALAGARLAGAREGALVWPLRLGTAPGAPPG